MSTCFVIMPITTPDHFLSTYHHDPEHFSHVLEHLFRPALQSLDYEIIPPSAAGADLIHAEIIRNLETADLVLCDMSIVNPNVFFELGVRTALNKPVCLVKDNVTLSNPFDTGIINFHTYVGDLTPWTLNAEVQLLKEHISTSVERSNGNNALWRYFGLTRVATPPDQESGTDSKIDLLTLQVEALNRKIENPTFLSSQPNVRKSVSRSHAKDFVETAESLARQEGAELVSSFYSVTNPANVELQFMSGTLKSGTRQRLWNMAGSAEIDLTISEV